MRVARSDHLPPALGLVAMALCSAAHSQAAQLHNDHCTVGVHPTGEVSATVSHPSGEQFSLQMAPALMGGETVGTRISQGRHGLVVRLQSGSGTLLLRVRLLADGCELSVRPETQAWAGFEGHIAGTGDTLYAARAALDDRGDPTVHGGGDVLEIAAGRACSNRANLVYETSSFRGVLLSAMPGSVHLRPSDTGYEFSFSRGRLRIRALDTWPLIGYRPAWTGSTFGHPEGAEPHVVPREWMSDHRPFPWDALSPVQLPFISITRPDHFDQVMQQVDFLAQNLRDWGFFCFGEWPLTQQNPVYESPAKAGYLRGNKRTCDYAHQNGIRILRWVTDPDIAPHWYPGLNSRFAADGWFSREEDSGEWLLDYTNPAVQAWLTSEYSDLGATGPDFYWVDNNHPTRPIHQPDLFPPDAFREFYRGVQRGLLSTGRKDILIRSGASAWADYSAVGILDVYAPGPDVENDWTEQQIYVARELARRDYLCHFNLWRRCVDDFFPAGPQTIDQTRAMGTLLGLTGLGFTTTDIGLPNIPAERLDLLRRLVPIPQTRPMDLCRFDSGRLPRWWVLNQQAAAHRWQVAGVFNWGLESEETHFKRFAELGAPADKEYIVYDGWSQAPLGRFRGAMALRIAPASGPALAIHPVEDYPFIVATDRHVTMGAAELSKVHWDSQALTLGADFTAGVSGHTFSLTVFCPDTLRPARATVDGTPLAIEPVTHGLYRFPVPCHSSLARVSVTFEHTDAGAAPSVPELPAEVIDIVHRYGEGAGPAQAKALARSLLAQAAAGQSVVLASPAFPSPALDVLQDALGMHWGLYREPVASSPWLLATPAEQGEASEGLLFRSTCIGFAPSVAHALVKPVGGGLLAVLRPWDGSATWTELARSLVGPAPEVLTHARDRAATLLRAATSTVGPFEVNGPLTQGAAKVSVSPALMDCSLSLHFKRLSRSLIGHEWAVPQISVFVNGVELPHNYNPCRPESPPQNWDSIYFAIPDGALRFDGTDRVVIRTARPAESAEAFRTDLRQGLELAIEDGAVAAETQLLSLPEVALVPPLLLDAYLGLDGGVRIVREAPGVGLRAIGGTPFNSWPARPGGLTHCIFDEDSFKLVITLPPGAEGVVKAFAFDSEAYRRQQIGFEGQQPVAVEQFGDGKWLSFPFDTAHTADGRLELSVRNVEGANCVLSRIRLETR